MKKSIQLHCVLPNSRSRSYDIVIGRRLMGEVVRAVCAAKVGSCAIITDHRVARLRARALQQRIRAQGLRVCVLAIAPGERSKNQKTKTALEHAMLQRHFGRDTIIIALGGGVVGDLAGFVAATYMRGLPYIQVPTTLLAMVDSSIGGKTGIDTPYGKNTIGAVWQPSRVMMDVDFLESLPRSAIEHGLIEATKMFLACDGESLPLSKQYLASPSAERAIMIVRASVRIKTAIVSRDETEDSMRTVLNFGHTIGHAVEQVSQYRVRHGHAVGFGVLVESKIAEMLGVLENREYGKVHAWLKPLLPPIRVAARLPIRDILTATRGDKKVRSGRPRYVLLQRIGQVFVRNRMYAHPVEDAVVRRAWSAVITG